MTQPGAKDALQCFPDKYLTKEHLETFFNDFNISVSASLPNASVFSHLVNSIRQVYMSEISEIHREISERSERRERKLPELTEQNEDRLDKVNRDREQERTVFLRPSEYAITQQRCPVIPFPADTAILYIGTALDPRRDMVGWSCQDGWGWTQRLQFKAFKFSEIGTIRISVCENRHSGVHRVNAFLKTNTMPEDWKELVEFHVFGSQRPNTEMISVGQNHDPERSIFVRGDHASKLDGWEEKFIFWAPL